MSRFLASAFFQGFEKALEKRALVTLVTPDSLLSQLEKGELSQYERENISQQLRVRELSRLLQGALFTGGGAALGGILGRVARYPLKWDSKYSDGILTNLTEAVGAGLGGWLGRSLEQVLLDPADRMRYRSSSDLHKKLKKTTFPLLAPSSILLPEAVRQSGEYLGIKT
jgi:hypothetical protein